MIPNKSLAGASGCGLSLRVQHLSLEDPLLFVSAALEGDELFLGDCLVAPFSVGSRPGDLLMEDDLVCVLLEEGEAKGDLSELSDLRDTLVGEVNEASLAEAVTRVLFTIGDVRGDLM